MRCTPKNQVVHGWGREARGGPRDPDPCDRWVGQCHHGSSLLCALQAQSFVDLSQGRDEGMDMTQHDGFSFLRERERGGKRISLREREREKLQKIVQCPTINFHM